MRRRALGALAATALAPAAAGCGSGGTTPGASRAGRGSTQVALARCMRSHGITNFPDPVRGPGGQGFSINLTPGAATVTVNGIGFAGPVFTAAEQSCKLFGGGTAPPAFSESQKQKLVAFARCMRAHGIQWADPTFHPDGVIEAGGGSGSSGKVDPATIRAVRACNRGAGL